MKKFLSIFIVFSCVVTSASLAAVNIKKAAPVATKKADTMESATSLLPAVIGLVSNVKTLQAQQQALSADCAPTSDEINTVNDLVKEWAKLGEVTPDAASSGLGERHDGGYQTCIDFADADESCYEAFSGSANEGTVGKEFPKASQGKKCKGDGDDDDYTQAEAKKVAQLKEKAQRCAPERIAAQKRELYGGFLTQTLSSVGQSSGAAGTSSVLDAVSSMGGSGDLKSMLPSLGQMATQALDK